MGKKCCIYDGCIDDDGCLKAEKFKYTEDGTMNSKVILANLQWKIGLRCGRIYPITTHLT